MSDSDEIARRKREARHREDIAQFLREVRAAQARSWPQYEVVYPHRVDRRCNYELRLQTGQGAASVTVCIEPRTLDDTTWTSQADE